MFIYLNKKAQSTAEYVIILGLVIGAVVAMQVYVKRGINGRIRDAVGYVDNGGQAALFTGAQYEPYYMATSNFSTNSASNESETGAAGSSVNRSTADNTSRSGSQTVSGAE